MDIIKIIRFFPLRLLILITLLACLLLASYLRLLTLRRHAIASATFNGCKPPHTLPTAALLGGLRYKLRLLLPRGDVLDRMMGDQYSRFGNTHALLHPYTHKTKGIYTVEPANIQTVLAGRFHDFQRPQRIAEVVRPFLGPGIFISNGEAWHDNRALLRPYFSQKRVKDFDIFATHFEHLLDAVGRRRPEERGGDGWTEQVDLKDLFYLFTLDTASEFLLGTSTDSQLTAIQQHRDGGAKKPPGGGEEKNTKVARGFFERNDLNMPAFVSAWDKLMHFSALRVKLGKYHWLADSFTYRTAGRTVTDFFDTFIVDACARSHARRSLEDKSKPDPNDTTTFGLIDELLTSYSDPIQIRNQTMQLFIAGREPTGALLSWLFALLAAHPGVFHSLRSAVISTFGTESSPNQPITSHSLASCTYLVWTINETMRLYPPGPLNGRVAVVDTSLPSGGGPDGKAPIFVPAGAIVVWNVYLLHRRTDIWGADAAEFRPERWAVKGCGGAGTFLPFSGGPQICIGQQHALAEASYVVVRMLQRFQELESLADEVGGNLVKGTRTMLSPKNGVRVRLRHAA